MNGSSDDVNTLSLLCGGVAVSSGKGTRNLTSNQPLDVVAGFIRRFVVLDDAQAVAITLWTAHTHVVDALGITPYMAITSAEKESGKTQLLEVLQLLVARPWLTGSVTAATLARKIHRDRPTLLLDESDAAFNGDKEYAETLRGVLNTGFRSSGMYSRCVGNGTKLDVQDFSTYSAKAIAGIGRLPDTAESRSIPIRLKKKAPGEKVERKRERTIGAEAEPIREALNVWTASIEERLSTFDIAPLEELPDRAADIWEPLLGIARIAGDNWYGRATKAAVALSGRNAVDDESTGVRLLADIKAIFEAAGDTEQLKSASIVDALVEIESSPWGEWHGKAISKIGVARILKRYDIRPKKIRSGETTFNGYHRDDFADAWSRYISFAPPVGVGTLGTLARQSQKQDTPSRNAGTDVPSSEIGANRHGFADVPTVPTRQGGKGEEDRNDPLGARLKIAALFDATLSRSKQPYIDGECALVCAICDSTYDEGHGLAEGVTCPACVALRGGLVTEREADEMRFLGHLRLAA